MKKNWHELILFSILAAYACCALPLFSAEVTGKVSSVLMIRGYNLLEFSLLGIVPLTVALLTAVILSMECKRISNNRTFFIVFVIYLGCYAFSYHAAWEWLETVENTAVTVHYGSFIHPLGILSVVGFRKIMNRIDYHIENLEIE